MYFNLFATMVVCGLWHGANWTFFLFGIWQGTMLCVEKRFGIERLYGWMPKALQTFVTFTIVALSFVLFRAPDLAGAGRMYRSLFGLVEVQDAAVLHASLLYSPYVLGTMLLAAAIVWLAPQGWDWTRTLTPRKAAAVALLLVGALALLATQDFNPFIYFIF
jgi:alginate O-acetyltransferase complex protein AlgI